MKREDMVGVYRQLSEDAVNAKGEMTATTILAKHDENYMPKEVVEQLKASGKWQEYGNKK